MCADGSEQPKIYRCTCTALKIRSTPNDGESKAQIEEWRSEFMNDQSQLTAVPCENRHSVVNNSTNRSSSGDPESPPSTLDLPNSQNFSQESAQVMLHWKMHQMHLKLYIFRSDRQTEYITNH